MEEKKRKEGEVGGKKEGRKGDRLTKYKSIQAPCNFIRVTLT